MLEGLSSLKVTNTICLVSIIGNKSFKFINKATLSRRERGSIDIISSSS